MITVINMDQNNIKQKSTFEMTQTCKSELPRNKQLVVIFQLQKWLQKLSIKS